MTEEVKDSDQAVQFLKDMAMAMWELMRNTDKEAASTISTALAITAIILEQEMKASSDLAEFVSECILDGFDEDKAIDQLAAWQRVREGASIGLKTT